MGTLSLTRKFNERIRLKVGETIIWIKVGELDRQRVRLMFDAPREVLIHREELLPLIGEEVTSE